MTEMILRRHELYNLFTTKIYDFTTMNNLRKIIKNLIQESDKLKEGANDFEELISYQEAEENEIMNLFTQQQEELLEKIIKEVMSGYGRETGVWHYEQNDINEYEASGFGDMLKIEEVSKYLKSLKQDLTKKGGE